MQHTRELRQSTVATQIRRGYSAFIVVGRELFPKLWRRLNFCRLRRTQSIYTALSSNPALVRAATLAGG